MILKAIYAWLQVKRNQVIFWYCRKMADAKHKADGLRYWVIRNKYNINEANRKLAKGERIDIVKLIDNALYRTK